MKILLAIDDSEFSEEALRAVTGRPWPPGSRVRVLSCIPEPVMVVGEIALTPAETIGEARDELSRDAERITAAAAGELEAAGLPAETAVQDGDPRSIIVEDAEEWGADLIVVGSHGYTGIKRWVLGSVAQSVVARAHCSVEVVRGKASRAAGS